MWTRQYIKDYAKGFLSKHYMKALVVCFIVALLCGGLGNSRSTKRDDSSSRFYNESGVIYQFQEKVASKTDNSYINAVVRGFKAPFKFMTAGILATAIILMIIFTITIGFVIHVGMCRFFLHGFKDDVSINKLFSTFNTKEYLPIVRTQFLTNLYIFLWGLLFIIPGIIKSYEYRFVPYILSEEPDLPSDVVIQRSREMTNGHKLDMFVLDLSFWGWFILGGFFWSIGKVFVYPYKEATYARLYNVLAGNDGIEIDHNVIVE